MTIIRTKAQEAVVAILRETLRRVRADVLMRQATWLEGDSLFIGGSEYELTKFNRILILGAGKASHAMALALFDLLEGRPVEGLIVTKYRHVVDEEARSGLEVMEAAHPVLDLNSIEAGRRMMDRARNA